MKKMIQNWESSNPVLYAPDPQNQVGGMTMALGSSREGQILKQLRQKQPNLWPVEISVLFIGWSNGLNSLTWVASSLIEDNSVSVLHCWCWENSPFEQTMQMLKECFYLAFGMPAGLWASSRHPLFVTRPLTRRQDFWAPQEKALVPGDGWLQFNYQEDHSPLKCSVSQLKCLWTGKLKELMVPWAFLPLLPSPTFSSCLPWRRAG